MAKQKPHFLYWAEGFFKIHVNSGNTHLRAKPLLILNLNGMDPSQGRDAETDCTSLMTTTGADSLI